MQSSGFKEIAGRSMLLLGGLLAGLLITEITLYILKIPHFYQGHSVPTQFEAVEINGNVTYVNSYSNNIRFLYESNPRRYFGPENDINHVTNSWGMRGPEFKKKPRDFFRLVFLGDSVTFGEGVKFEDTYPEMTSYLLNRIYQSNRLTFQSYNFGVGGYNTVQELYVLKSIIKSTEPDIVIVGYVVNDAETALLNVDFKEKKLVRRTAIEDNYVLPSRSLIFKSRLALLIWQIVKKREKTAEVIAYYSSLFKETNPSWVENRRALEEIISLCGQSGIPCYVIMFPMLYNLNDDYPFLHIESMIEEIVTRNGGEFISILPHLKGKDPAKLIVHPADFHPNEIVHKIAASLLADRIILNGEIEERVSREEKVIKR